MNQLLYQTIFRNNYWTVTTDLFYNFSPRVLFTKNSAFIRDYLDLTNQNIVNEIANTEFITADIPGILGLFGTIKLQQHRAGLMFGFARQWDHFLITAQNSPLLHARELLFRLQMKSIESKTIPSLIPMIHSAMKKT